MDNSFQLFRAWGIAVHVHFFWFILLLFWVDLGAGPVTIAWQIAVLLTIFAIVLLHEFGHALATRSVGGRAENIMLWPLGGVAFVQPPQRPGAVLWSIAAGPLVNVLLVPLLFGLREVTGNFGGALGHYGDWVFMFNFIVLIFNLLPIYPLDGGQILQSLLWFVLGQAQSLRIAAGIGVIGAVVGVIWAISLGKLWLILIALFVGWQAWIGWQQARQLAATR